MEWLFLPVPFVVAASALGCFFNIDHFPVRLIEARHQMLGCAAIHGEDFARRWKLVFVWEVLWLVVVAPLIVIGPLFWLCWWASPTVTIAGAVSATVLYLIGFHREIWFSLSYIAAEWHGPPWRRGNEPDLPSCEMARETAPGSPPPGGKPAPRKVDLIPDLPNPEQAKASNLPEGPEREDATFWEEMGDAAERCRIEAAEAAAKKTE